MKRGRKSAAEREINAMIRQRSSLDEGETVDNPPEPPEHLTPGTQEWWRAIVSRVRLEPHQVRTLEIAGEAWDLKERARQALAEYGLSYTDAKGMVRARPEAAIERDSRTAFLRAMRELDLKVEPPGRGLHPALFGLR